MSGHRVHGPEGHDQAPDWAPLTATEIDALLARYALPVPATILWRSPRPLSAAALVRAGGENLFVKRHHEAVRTPATLRKEHRFIKHLREQGAAVPEVLATPAGETAPASGPWTFELHRRAAGVDLYRDLQSWQPPASTAHARAAGTALAHLHEAAQGYAAPDRGTHILVTRAELLLAADPLATLAAQFPQRPALAAWLSWRDWCTPLAAHILPAQQAVRARAAAEPRLWTHNDWHVSNLTWSDRGPAATVTMAFDFGLCSPTFALFDLATAIERNAIRWLELPQREDIADAGIARALVEGYASVRPLSAADRRLVADLLPVVHLDFALSEIEYFHGVTHNATHARLAWDAFLIGHARWFEGSAGRELQAAIAAA